MIGAALLLFACTSQDAFFAELYRLKVTERVEYRRVVTQAERLDERGNHVVVTFIQGEARVRGKIISTDARQFWDEHEPERTTARMVAEALGEKR